MLSDDDALGFVINAVARKFSQLFNLRCKAFDITAEQWSVLSKLVEHNGITQRDLSSITEKDPNNITRLLDQLERKGWVRRTDNPLDRRSYIVLVTDNGERLASELKPLDQSLLQELLTSLTLDEVMYFQKMLHQINKILSEKIANS